jgi:hypothetical protein
MVSRAQASAGEESNTALGHHERYQLENPLNENDLLRRIAGAKLPFRLLTPEDLSAAKALMASGLIKVTLPLARNSRFAFGKQDNAFVSAITLAGKRALKT